MTPDSPLTDAEKAAASERGDPYIPVVPAPEPYSLPAKSLAGKRLPKPDLITEYRRADGALCFIVARWNQGTADLDKKHIAPCSHGTLKGKLGWHWKGFPAPRPILNAPLLSAQPTAPVLIVEGEKTAHAAPRYAPEGWLVTTWHGGAQAFTTADLTALHGHRCVIWMDNDEPGWKAAAALLTHLQSLGIAAAVIPRIAALPDAWDLADPLPEGVTPDSVTALITRTAERCAAPTATAPEPAPDTPPLPDIGSTTEEFQPVGYNEQTFYFISKNSQQIHSFGARSLLDRKSLLELVPSHAWWQTKYQHHYNASGGLQWEHIGAELIQSCYTAGVYSDDRVRGRGAWLDEKRIVLHTGDSLMVDGQPIKPSQIRSEFIYPRSARFTDLRDTLPLDEATARELRRICNLVRWENRLYGDILLGLIATSVVCGALKWRTHGWVTGPAGSGKSWLVDNLIGTCLGDVALYPVGVTSEAGIRQTLGRDARPVVFDEAEGRGPAGITRREAIIELMRQAAHQGRGKIYKGSSSHDPTQFTIRSQFILASIGVGLREGADETRCIVMTLQALDAHTEAAKQAQEKHFMALRQASDAMPPDLAPRLLIRMIGLIPTLLANAETFAAVIAQKLGNRRMGDLIGTPLAGCYTLITGAAADPKTVSGYVDRFDWREFVKTKEIREDIEVIRHLMGCVVRTAMNGGLTADRTIGELCAVAAEIDKDERLYPGSAAEQLRRHGIRWDVASDGFYVANQSAALDELMRGSDYAQGYQRILGRHPGAVTSPGSIRFAGTKCRAIWLPKASLVVTDDPQAGYDPGDDYPR